MDREYAAIPNDRPYSGVRLGLVMGTSLIVALPSAAIAQTVQDDAPSPTTLADASSVPTNTSDLFEKDEHSDDIATGFRQERMTVPVNIDGKGPYHFLVDTGSETTVVSRQLAAQLGLSATGQAKLIGALNSIGVDTIRVGEINVGRQTMEDLPAVLLDADHLGAAGILGIDTLRDHRVIFDFGNDNITIGPSQHNIGRDGYEIVVRAKRKEDRMVISNARIDGIRVHLVIDTGSNYSIGNGVLGARLRKDSSIGTAGIMDVTGAKVDGSVMIIHRMEFGTLTLTESPILINDSPAFAELGLEGKPAILLGMNHLRAFSRMSVDFGRREIAFDLAN